MDISEDIFQLLQSKIYLVCWRMCHKSTEQSLYFDARNIIELWMFLHIVLKVRALSVTKRSMCAEDV